MADIIMAEKSYTIQNQMVSLQRQVGNLQNQITKDKKAYQLLETEVTQLEKKIELLEYNFLFRGMLQERIAHGGYSNKMVQAIVLRQQNKLSQQKQEVLLQRLKELRDQKKVAAFTLQTQIDKNKQIIACNQNQIGKLKIDRELLKI